MATIAAKIGATTGTQAYHHFESPLFSPFNTDFEGRREPNEDQGHVQGSNQDQ